MVWNVLGVTAPIYLMMVLGFVAVRAGWLAAPDLRALGRFVVQFALPALLFTAVMQRPLADLFDARFLLMYALGTLAIFGVVFAWALRRSPGRSSMPAMMALGATSPNTGYVGYPIVLSLLGPKGASAVALLFLVENLLIIPLGLALAERATQADGARGLGALVQQTLRGMITNPLVLAVLAGLLCSFAGVVLPAVVSQPIQMLATASTPAALMVIGGSLVGLKVAGVRGDLAAVVMGKLLLHPLAVAALMAWWSPQDPTLWVAAVLFAAMPPMGIYPVLAQRFDQERFTAAALLVGTLASFVTLNALVAWIRHAGLA